MVCIRDATRRADETLIGGPPGIRRRLAGYEWAMEGLRQQ
jgi:hypothetical protein